MDQPSQLPAQQQPVVLSQAATQAERSLAPPWLQLEKLEGGSSLKEGPVTMKPLVSPFHASAAFTTFPPCPHSSPAAFTEDPFQGDAIATGTIPVPGLLGLLMGSARAPVLKCVKHPQVPSAGVFILKTSSQPPLAFMLFLGGLDTCMMSWRNICDEEAKRKLPCSFWEGIESDQMSRLTRGSVLSSIGITKLKVTEPVPKPCLGALSCSSLSSE